MDLADDRAVTLEGKALPGRMTAALAAARVGEWDADLKTGEVALSALSRRLIGLPEHGRVTLDDIQAHRHARDSEDPLRRDIFAEPPKGFIRHSYRFGRADGGSRWLEMRGTIFRDSTGRPLRVLGVMLDVTEREERALALEQSWRRFEVALANTAIVVFEQDQELRYTWIHNPPLGYEAYRIVGKTDVEIMGEARGAPVEAKKRLVLETGRALQTEVTVPGEAGLQDFDLHIEPLRDERGVVVGIACAGIALGPLRADTGSQGRRRLATPRRTVEDRDLLLDRISARLDMRHRDRGLIPICTSALERKLTGFAGLSVENCAMLHGLEADSRYVGAKELVYLAAGDDRATWLVGTGWVYSYFLFPDGRRQIIGFHLPGDLIGHGGQLTTAGQHLYATATDCVLCTLEQASLSEILRGRTTLAKALRWAADRDAGIIEQHLVSIGRRSAEARLVHLLLELGDRLAAVHLADPGGYRCPLTQELLADALGLTNVHVNRLLRRLRDRGLLSFIRGFVAFTDKPRLIELAEYDPTYLDCPAIEPTARPFIR